MLASITPLGERGRNSRWTVTVSAMAMGSTLAAASLGGVLGGLGWLLELSHVPVSVRLGIVTAGVILGLGIDSGLLGLRLPTVRRQVNEEWLDRYRGWVYGSGFGLQLGLGVVTVVTTSSVYAVFLVAFLSASPIAGALVGASFGVVRASTMIAVAGIRRPEQLPGLATFLRRWEARSRRLSVSAMMLVGVLAAGATVAAAMLGSRTGAG